MKKVERYDDTQVNGDILKYTVRQSFWMLLPVILLSGIFIYLFFFNGREDLNVNNQFMYFLTVINAIAITMVIYRILITDEYQINMHQFSISKKKQLLSIPISTTEIKWNKESNYKYEIEYDSYSKITAVWFIANHKLSNKNRKLIKFHDMDSFNEFKDIFEKQFTNHTIGEWHA